MQTIPVDHSRMGTMLFIGVSPDFDSATGEHRVDRNEMLLWKVEFLHRPESRGEFTPKSSVEIVKIASPSEPKIREMSPIFFEGLTARLWEMNGRAGLSLSADGIRTAPAGGE